MNEITIEDELTNIRHSQEQINKSVHIIQKELTKNNKVSEVFSAIEKQILEELNNGNLTLNLNVSKEEFKDVFVQVIKERLEK